MFLVGCEMSVSTEAYLIAGLVAVFTIVNFFITWLDRANRGSGDMRDEFTAKWTEVSRNLTENTATLKQLQEYLKRLETDINRRLEKHEERMDRQDERLDGHREKIIRLEATLKGEKDE